MTSTLARTDSATGAHFRDTQTRNCDSGREAAATGLAGTRKNSRRRGWSRESARIGSSEEENSRLTREYAALRHRTFATTMDPSLRVARSTLASSVLQRLSLSLSLSLRPRDSHAARYNLFTSKSTRGCVPTRGQHWARTFRRARVPNRDDDTSMNHREPRFHVAYFEIEFASRSFGFRRMLRLSRN